MIGYLSGTLIDISSETPEVIVVDVQGVGYEVHASSSVIDNCEIGQKLTIFIYTHLREEALTLFGFASRLEKELFLSLLKVNGVGPRLAIKVVSGSTVEQIIEWIENAEIQRLVKIPKLGKKTAEQIIITLRGKLTSLQSQIRAEAKSKQADLEPTSSAKAVSSRSMQNIAGLPSFAPSLVGVRADIVSALINLGYRAADAELAVQSLDENIEFERGVRTCLQAMAPRTATTTL